SALRAVLAAVRPDGIDLALRVAVLPRVGVDDAADCAVLGGDLGLDASPRAVVAGDDDLPLHADTAPLQLFVVLRDAVIDVDELARDVSVDGVGVIDRQ